MIQELRRREVGHFEIKSSNLFETKESDRRLTTLGLSKYKNFEAVHKTPVVCGNVDPTECRYFLSGGVDGTLSIHDLQDQVHSHGDVVSTYKVVVVVDKRDKPDVAHRFSIETASWYPFDTGLCFTSGGDKLLKIWDVNTMTPVDEFAFSAGVNDHDVSSIASAKCLIAVATASSRIKLVDLKSGVSTHVLRGHDNSVLSLEWSPKEEFKLASAGRDRRVLLWDIRRIKSVLMSLDMSREYEEYCVPSTSAYAHRSSAQCVKFTPEGNHILTLGAEGQLCLWNSVTGEIHPSNFENIAAGPMDRKSSVAISDAGLRSLVFCPSRDNIHVFDLYTGANVTPDGPSILKGHFQHVNFVSLHPWMHELYSGANDRNLIVWSSLSSQRETAYEEHLELKHRLQNFSDPDSGNDTKIQAYMDNWSDYSDDET